ncbi:hypothetical protein MRS76_19605 [Rhizobiaceae bacterium n13]|uniref:Uncharacterized protein n=1 Tax=Ferirhizobium litorale TaxID=2927786 RepID=A0AAE3QI18_9HYPH|nr:hypothetical protein [Fererhizobium litorale]MDI7864155.1 hypothetical protein [Fererhizobium litorale]MDI7923766.1 hypothetical protein [Fererhizobium litorale]
MEEVFRFTFIAPPREPEDRQILRLPFFGTRAGVLLRHHDRQPIPHTEIEELLEVLERPSAPVLDLLAEIRRRMRAEITEQAAAENPVPVNVCAIAAAVAGAAVAGWLQSPEISSTRQVLTERLAAAKFSGSVSGREFQQLYNAYITLAVLDQAQEAGCEVHFDALRRQLRRVIIFDNPLAGRAMAAEPPENEHSLMVATAELAGLLDRRVEARNALNDLGRIGRRAMVMRRMELTPEGRVRLTSVEEGRAATEEERARTHLFISDTAVARLSPHTREFLTAVGIDITETPAALVARSIEDLDRNAETAIARLTRSPRLIGARAALPSTSAVGPAATLNLGFSIEEGPKVPTTVGLVRPVGVGRLQVTMQQLKRYEGGDLAHVENVLLSERKERTTRRLERIEDVFTQEEETTRAEERDLQTTQRSEIQSEVQSTLSESESFRIGGSISGGYGPFVQAEVSTGYETSSSSESSSRNAATYAQEIMEKAAVKVTEKTRELRTITTIREFEETNLHEFNNIEGDDNISGMFQWLNRVYEAQVYDFGIRLFFDIMIPDPAAFYRQVKHHTSQPNYDIMEPVPFDIEFTSLNETNYKEYGAAYGVGGLDLPPPFEVVQYLALQGAASEGSDAIELVDSITLQPGYMPFKYNLRLYIDSNAEDDAQFHMNALSVQVGRHFETYPPEEFNPDDFVVLTGQQRGYMVIGNVNPTGGADHLGPLPVSIFVRGANRVHATLELFSQDQTAEKAWQKATWAKLRAGYETALSAYNSRLAELQSQEGIEIEGMNSLEARRIQEDELKRAAISMVTGQYFEHFSAILQSGIMEARVDFDEAEAEGRYAKFFEECFEWEKMEFTYYPYYWAPRSTWVERMVTNDPDPLFASFLKASFAKLRLAVRPDFEQALLHFFETGVVWKGGDLPPVTDQNHIGLLVEIRERRSEELHHERFEVGEPFDIRLPTTLVRLRPGNTLPSWSKTEDGAWVEDPAE